ncbi:MAG: PAS domain S-box protein [Methanomicrobium sp.]|nr:PAS domain S-box protein [Methanomicrobium sp.]
MSLNSEFLADKKTAFALIIMTIFCIVISFFSLSSGFYIIFQNFFYIPIILACIFYLRRGLLFSVILSFVYLGLLTGYAGFNEFGNGIARTLIFIGIACIITILSEKTKYANDKVREKNKELKYTIEKLALSCDRYHTLFESISDSLFLYKIDENGLPGLFIEVNSSASESIGYSREEFLRMTALDIAGEIGKREAKEQVEILYKKGSHKFESSQVRKDGTEFPVEVNCHLIRTDSQGCLVLSVVRDITDRKKIEMALKDEITRRRILQDQSRDGIIIIREDGSVFEVNKSFADMLYYSVDDVKKMHIWEWNQSVPREIISNMLKTVDEKGDHFETRHLRKDGTEIDVDISTTAANFSGEKLILCICRDITAWKNSEKALINLNKKLSLLSYITCHDILNKANALEIFISLLDKKDLNPDIQPYLGEAVDAVNLIMSQIEFAREYGKVGVNEPLWLSLEEITKELSDVRAELNFECKGIYVYADAMLEKVFYNLFDNTLRHTKGLVLINIRCRIGGDSTLIISWEDNGPGIEDSKKEKIFESGYGQNTGFGLFLAREILDITKIKISEVGVFGKGATFELSVPKGGYYFEEKGRVTKKIKKVF